MTLTEQQRTIIWTVVARFLDIREPTSRRQLLRKFKNRDAINNLLKRPFFAQVQNDAYLPLPLAFRYCGNADCLARAKEATELTLRILQNLDEAHPEREKGNFTREEFRDHAARICDPKPDDSLLMLGLQLCTYLSVFSSWSSEATGIQVPTSFSFHEDIVTINPAQAWDEYIKGVDGPPAEARQSALETDPDTFDFDFTEIGLPRTTRPAAVRPVGKYDYHPEIKRVSERLWLEGNFRQAVLDAFIHLIATVKERTALKNAQGLPYDGDDLMNRAFCPDNRVPPVRFNPFRTDAD